MVNTSSRQHWFHWICLGLLCCVPLGLGPLGCGRIGFEQLGNDDSETQSPPDSWTEESETPTSSETINDSATNSDSMDQGSEIDTDSDTGSSTDQGSDWDTGIGTDTSFDSDTATVTDIDTDSDTGADTGADTASDTGEDTDTGTGALEPCPPALPTGVDVISESHITDYSRFGEATVTVEAVTGQSFSQTWRATTNYFTGLPGHAQQYILTKGNIAAGDHLVAEFWTRCISSDTGTCRTGSLVELANSPWSQMVAEYVESGANWEFHQVPFVASTDLAAGAARWIFRLGYSSQVIEIAPIRIVNYGAVMAAARPDCLPDTTSVYSEVKLMGTMKTTAHVDVEYLHAIEANGFPMVDAIVTGLPDWLHFNADQNVLHGVPTYSDVGTTGPITIAVSNINGSDVSAPVSITVMVDPALAGHWPLDETAGTTVTDASGNDRHGTLYGDESWQPTGGQVGGAISMDSAAGAALDYIELPSDGKLDTIQSSSYTLALWVKPTTIPSGTTTGADDYSYNIIAKGSGNTGIWYGHDQRFHGIHQFASATVEEISGTFAPGTFHHVAVVFNSAANLYSMYVDGSWVLFGTSFSTGADYAFGVTPWRIGVADPSGVSGDMVVDDVRIYERALTEREIKNLAGVVVSP